jgi:hypothetical protein
VTTGEAIYTWTKAALCLMALGWGTSTAWHNCRHYRAAIEGCTNHVEAEYKSAKHMLNPRNGHCYLANGDYAQTDACVRARHTTERVMDHDIQACYERDLKEHRGPDNPYYAIWLDNVVYRYTRLVSFCTVLAIVFFGYYSCRQVETSVQATRERRDFGKLPTQVVEEPTPAAIQLGDLRQRMPFGKPVAGTV